MDFKILGLLEVTAGQRRLAVHGARQQIVLMTLLLSANKVVPMGRLIEAVYGQDEPPTARSQVQIGISSLRRLFAVSGSEEVITTHAYGYVVRVGDGQLDSTRFEKLVGAARAARASGHLELAVASYRDALRLWRGPAAEGVDSQLVRVAASRLDELRISANEDRIELELDLGRHHELVAELTELAVAYPLRERLRGQLMLSLYRCDRTAEALQVYQDTRRSMVDELGIEPGDRLHRLQRAVLTADPALDLPAVQNRFQAVSVQVPNLLPADIADFMGRAEQVAEISRHLVSPDDEARLAVPVIAIAGKGGVGKTTLAVHVSHRLAGHFPDGVLYADMHGGAPHSVSAWQVLERFLRALGLRGAHIPATIDERAEMYRNMLANRRVLILLDDVLSERDVVSLLPGDSTAAVLVTSRSRLTGLPGAHHLEIDVFGADDSMGLLARIAGASRIQSEAAAAAAVAEQCGRLPLALRIAGARLAARPHWSVQQLVDCLADETHRLDELRHGGMGIRPSISFTYESIDEQARLLFRRLAMLDMPSFSGWLSAALLGVPLATAEKLLDDLVNAQLVEVTGCGSSAACQYRFHDLIRVFARERLVLEDPPAERKAALGRALSALLCVAEQAHRRYFGGDFVRIRGDAQSWSPPLSVIDQLVEDPLAWYERERLALVSSVRQAAHAGLVELCWSLAVSSVPLFESRVYLDEWRETHEIALQATRKEHHVHGEAAILYSTGSLHIMQQRFDLALQELTDAMRLFEKSDDRYGAALAIRHIAYLDRLGGRRDQAMVGYEQALAVFRETDDLIGMAYVLQGMAQVKLEENEFSAAMDLLSEGLALCQTARCDRIEAQVIHRAGEACLLMGDPINAIRKFGEVLSIARGVGDPIGEAYALQGMGVAESRQGHFDKAREALQSALELAIRVGERFVQGRIILAMSELALVSGDYSQATVHGKHAVTLFGGLKVPLYQAQALGLLTRAHRALGDAAAAQETAREAGLLHATLGSGSLRDAGPDLLLPRRVGREDLPQRTWPIRITLQLFGIAKGDFFEPDSVLPACTGDVQVPVNDGLGTEPHVPVGRALGAAPLGELLMRQD